MAPTKHRTDPRNQNILERRWNGESLASIGKSFGISAARVKQIFEREDGRVKRAQELAEPARLPQQPNPLQLPAGLRDLLGQACGKPDFTLEDLMHLDNTTLFFLRLPLSRRDWKDLTAWMATGGLALERPGRKAAVGS